MIINLELVKYELKKEIENEKWKFKMGCC
jgi:hypothetical protein